MGSNVLDTSLMNEARDVLIDAIDEAGFSAVEAIPGLIAAIYALSGGDDRLLDAAANLLADGVEE